MNLTFKDYLQSLRGKRVAVVGMGISNTPLIERLLEAGISTIICDQRSRAELGALSEKFEHLGAAFRLGEQYLKNLDADVIFRTPGLMPTHPDILAAVARGAVLTSEMEVFFTVCPCMTIGITGSDGKTTTTSIIAELLRREGSRTIHVGGNIGTPLLCIADDMSPDDIAVLELSSFQLVSMRQSPDIAVVTNLAPNHLDVHNDMEEYAEAKSHIFAHQTPGDRAVFNFDNDFTREYAAAAPSENILFFSRQAQVRDGVFLENGMIYTSHDGQAESLMTADDILLPGVHNIENFMAAFAAVRGFVSRDVMIDTARTFNGVAHRIELVRERSGVRYYNDSIATSPTRTMAGLKSFDKKVILIAGGKDKGVPFDTLGGEIIAHVKTLVLTGHAADQIRDAVVNAPGYTAGTPEIIMQPDFAEAIKTAADAAGAGDVVILSPACSSFDRFKNFEERGNAFRDIVKGL
ncbi:MAG: UDP-N-acetylmuramoyl-L-alanine--D-glutamate ligase [Oscillospiraceae bacterium]|nr:UDP-N-acetylmuramoyl-L-alanine--D-glutamate ligase [Oscillospiraceae bacterium]